MSALHVRQGLAATVLLSGLLLLGSGSWIHIKAQLAQWLMEGAWAATVAGAGAGDRKVRPWPWADGYPVARLRAREGAVDLIVLAGSEGRNLAFAPGHVAGSDLPGTAGYTIIGGHRDTHFRFLQTLAAGDDIDVQGRDGTWVRYRVDATQVADIRRDRLPLSGAAGQLLLVTCWPFDALRPGGPQRYLVSARISGPSG